jgi:hypothetical protein
MAPVGQFSSNGFGILNPLVPAVTIPFHGKQPGPLMSTMHDRLEQRNSELLDGVDDCVDRIVLNGYFRLATSAGGFRMCCTFCAKR